MPASFQPEKIRGLFPALQQQVYGRPLVYLDNAATTQKPISVISTLVDYYSRSNSNIHRGAHYLSQQATEAFENTRKEIAGFIRAASPSEIIFTRGTTEAVNLVASSFGKKFLKTGDEVVISVAEHHSNFVPWQQICFEKQAILRVVPAGPGGHIEAGTFREFLNERTRLVAFAHVSNALGSVNDVKELTRLAHEAGAVVLIDGAQAVSHIQPDVQEMDCDFYCFSGHKMYAPMGIGVLYGKEKILEELPPYQFGGEMISRVSIADTTWNELPFKFEAGTPNVGDVLGLGEAVRFLLSTGYENIAAHETMLLREATAMIEKNGGSIVGKALGNRAGVISFLLDDIHPFDAGTILDKMGVAVRTGNHCTQPLMDFLGIPGTIRASFAIYNSSEEISLLEEGIRKVQQLFG